LLGILETHNYASDISDLCLSKLQLPFLHFIVLLPVAGALACADAEVTPLGAPQLVLSEIRLGGAERVAERIDNDLGFGQTVMEGIASGDSVWLEVARHLELKSAAAEASFAIALAGALPKNPNGVLPLIGPKARVGDVCGMPFIDASAASVTAYYDSSTTALSRPLPVAYAGIVQECAATLDSARVRKLTRIDPGYIIKNKPAPPKPPVRRRRAARPRR
jgi:hypothetical protein